MTTVILPFYTYSNSRIKRLCNLKEFARRGRLFFSSSDEVGGNVIALDRQKRKLVFFKKTPNTTSCLLIDLADLENCVIKKEYSSIGAGALQNKKLHHFLKAVFIKLGFKNYAGNITLPLYKAETDHHEDAPQVEVKAKKWETIISKFKRLNIKEIA